MTTAILEQLSSIEKTEGAHILYACESGSRAWGFASPDSDYDVRFIYAQPRDNYLSIRDRKDIIQLPVNADLDVNGWDLRKALQLFLRSNSTLYEWLQSPIVYREQTPFARDLRGLMNSYYSHRAGCHHYLSMAYNALSDLRSTEVRLKKYFYALRPTLACRWIMEKRTVPPMEFGILRTGITDARWNSAVDDLLRQKGGAGEKTVIPPVAFLRDWLETTLPQYKDQADSIPPVKHDTEHLDKLFRNYVA